MPVICPKCGASNVDGAAFCAACGTTLTQPYSSAPPQPGSPPIYGGSAGYAGRQASYSMSRAFHSAIALVQNPVAFMTANRDTQPTTRDIIVNYVAPLAAITFIATLIGDVLTAAIFGFGAAAFVYAFVDAVVAFILFVVAVFIVGFVIKALALNFRSQPNEINSLKLASYSFTPFFLASILYIIPFGIIGEFFSFLGLLYGLYILYKGLPIMVATPQDQVIVYELVIVVVSIIIFAIINFVVHVFV